MNFIKKNSVKLKQAKIAFTEIKKHLGFFISTYLILKMILKSTIKTKYYSESKEIEKQILPFIILYKDLEKRLDKKLVNKIGKEILTQCCVLDLILTFPKLNPNNGSLKEYLEILKNSKYFSYSNYKIVEESCDKARLIVTKCGYCEVLKKYELMELAPCLCKSDIIFFETYHPKLKFILEESIAKGDRTCKETYLWGGN
jgi:hypothetical protein